MLLFFWFLACYLTNSGDVLKKKKKGGNLAFNCGNLSGTLPHVCFKCHWTTTRVLYRTANCCIEMYIFVKIFLLKACLLSLCIFSLCIKTDGVRLKKKTLIDESFRCLCHIYLCFNIFFFQINMNWRTKEPFVWPPFMALVTPHPPVITACFPISVDGSCLTLITPPVADGSHQNDTLTGLSSLSVWICVKLTALRAELDGSLSSLVGLIASVSLGWCRISVFSD